MTKLLSPLALVVLLTASHAVAQAKSGDETLTNFFAENGFAGAAIARKQFNDPFVRVMINGKPGSMLVATAAVMSGIDRNRARKFGLVEVRTNRRVISSFGPSAETAGMSTVNTLGMGNCVITKVPVAIVNLGSLQLDGVFGRAEMRKFGAVLDCGRHMLYINPRGRDSTTSTKLVQLLASRGFTRVPMRLKRGRGFHH